MNNLEYWTLTGKYPSAVDIDGYIWIDNEACYDIMLVDDRRFQVLRKLWRRLRDSAFFG